MKANRICKHCNELFENIEGNVFSNHVKWCNKNPVNYRNKEHIDKIKEGLKKSLNERLGEEKEFKVICEKCGIEFKVIERENKFPSKEKYYCSRKCANSRNKIIEKKKSFCICCGKEILIHKQASIKNCKCKECKKSKPKTKVKKKQINEINNCLNCNKNIKRGNKFCSIECCNFYKWNEKKKDIESGDYQKTISGQNLYVLKKFMIEKFGHICSICENKIWNGKPIPLVLDHINGRCLDNRIENLRLVCGNCDMQLPTYKSKNKNSDRKRKA